MFRRTIAGLILGPALLIGSIAWWGFLAQRTVFDESRTQTIAEELLDNDAVTEQIGINVGKALEAAMPESIQLTEEQVAAGVDIIMADPVVRDLIIQSLGTTHRAFLGLDDAPAEIDLGPALESSRERIGIFAPTVADAIPDSFAIELPTERIPNASPVKTFLERAVPILAGLSIIMALLAFLTTSDRSQVLGKAARWAIGTTAFYLIVGLGVPYLLRQFAPDGAEVLAALLTAVLRAALIPSIVLGIVGAGLLLASMFWRSPDRAKKASEPRRSSRRDPVAPTPAAPTSAPRSAPRSAPDPRPPARSPQPTAPTSPRPSPAADDTATIPVAAPLPTPAPKAAPFASPPLPAPPPVPRRAPEPAPIPRPTLPTRARRPDSAGLPAWTGDAVSPESSPESPPEPTPVAPKPKWLPPTWVPEHGWVMDPDDEREPPNNAAFVDGVGWVVPGPPPADA